MLISLNRNSASFRPIFHIHRKQLRNEVHFEGIALILIKMI